MKKFLKLDRPELYDFKTVDRNKGSSESIHPIELFLRYKNGELKVKDCDKEAFFIYQTFGWQEDVDSIIRGEVMNSFWNPYKTMMKLSYPEKWRGQHPTLKDIPYILAHFHEFQEVHENHELKKFATLTHTIGNFIVIPHWMNTGRSLPLRDYWDLTLKSLYDYFHLFDDEDDAWEKFIQIFYLEPFVERKKFEPKIFDKLHFASNQGKDELNLFLQKTNQRIEQRGKYMVNELYKSYESEKYNAQMKILFSDEL